MTFPQEEQNLGSANEPTTRSTLSLVHSLILQSKDAVPERAARPRRRLPLPRLLHLLHRPRGRRRGRRHRRPQGRQQWPQQQRQGRLAAHIAVQDK